MLCNKCGKEIPDNSKFCGYCGQNVENVESLNSTNNQEVVTNSSDDIFGIGENESTQVQSDINIQPNAIVNGDEQVDTNNQQESNYNINSETAMDVQTSFESLQSATPVNPAPESNTTKNKKSNKMLFIIIAAILVIAINVFAFMSLNKNKSSKANISVLEKAVGNINKKGENSGTMTLAVRVESVNEDAINLSANLLYEKVNDDYNFNIKINKSAITEEMNLYSVINKDNVNVYVESKTIDMLGLTKSDTNTWLVYSQAIADITSQINKDENITQNVNFKDIIDKDHFKLVGKEGGLNHYKLIIDEKLFENAKNKLELDDEDKETIESAIESIKASKIKSFEIDLYITKSNEISKISIDLAKIINIADLKKAEVSIEFKDFNNTKVVIPQEALKSTMTIEDYTTQYSIDVDFDDDFDFDTDDDFDFDFDIDDDASFNLNI